MRSLAARLAGALAFFGFAALLFLGIYYQENWSEAGAACKAKGGKLYVDGCYQITLHKLY